MIPQRLMRAYATVVYGQTAPHVTISGLTLTGPLQAGSVAQVEFTATNTLSALIGEFVDREQVVTGAVVGPGGVVMAVFGPFTITTGPFGGPTGTLQAGAYALVHLTTTTPIPTQAAGQEATVYVGDLGAFAGVAVNQTFNPPLNDVLSVTKPVLAATAAPVYKYPASDGGSGIAIVGQAGLPKTVAGLTTTNWAMIIAAGLAVGGAVLVYRTINPPELAAARVQARATEAYAGALGNLAPAGQAYARRYG